MDSSPKGRQKAIANLVARAKKLESPILLNLVMKVAVADPFIKVKKLIQDLIERLVTEASEEATKKGWCDTEMSKAIHTRTKHNHQMMEINGELESFEATKSILKESVKTLATEIIDLNDSLAKQVKIRVSENADNMDILDKAKEGLQAVKSARSLLQSFYKKGAKAKVFLQASPVDEDAPDAGPRGAYRGGQKKATGIIAMLDVIVSDFERTIRVTQAAEEEAAREYIEFERSSKTSLVAKTTGKGQAETDLKSVTQSINEAMPELGRQQDMLDDSLKVLEDLKPACVNTGMSYEDRVAKRKEEINALKQAVCELDHDGVETDCQ